MGFVSQPDVQGGTIALRVHRHRAQPEFAAGTHDADRNFAAIGDEHFPAGGHSGILPCFLGGFLSRLFSQLASAAMSLARVIRGRMTSSTYPREAATKGLASFSRNSCVSSARFATGSPACWSSRR